jgi:hypothetical protein
MDVIYLAYLPFCNIFISSDKFHKNCASLFLRENQKFVWGQDIKADLKNIDKYFDSFSVEDKMKGLYVVAPHPPVESPLVRLLWDEFLPGWNNRNEVGKFTTQSGSKLADYVGKFTKAKTIPQNEINFDLANPDSLVVERHIKPKRGKWWLVPSSLASTNK